MTDDDAAELGVFPMVPFRWDWRSLRAFVDDTIHEAAWAGRAPTWRLPPARDPGDEFVLQVRRAALLFMLMLPGEVLGAAEERTIQGANAHFNEALVQFLLRRDRRGDPRRLPRWIGGWSAWRDANSVIAFEVDGFDVLANFGSRPAAVPDGSLIAASDEGADSDSLEGLPPFATILFASK
ncbi:hypothetical protein [Parafrankia sp. EUN1f]|uniref:hypothetical protein n=1 Tax=Parafrankia sp. EUN1f TaxID=102897 RepID=UPI0001C43E1F|nr:hypothetical protein [Parafrankia sp. EUN1f]EFC85607.1 hypothetical protein FrEUN1fDRAFT_1272 [Parafrankia sp. EUN1f]